MAKLDEFKTLNEVELSAIEGGVAPILWKILATGGALLYDAFVANQTEDCNKHFDPRWCVKTR